MVNWLKTNWFHIGLIIFIYLLLILIYQGLRVYEINSWLECISKIRINLLDMHCGTDLFKRSIIDFPLGY